MLPFEEISFKASININTETLSYTGHTDYGEEMQCKDNVQKVNDRYPLVCAKFNWEIYVAHRSVCLIGSVISNE